VIRPLLSRVQVLVLEPLSDDELSLVLQRALKDEHRGLGSTPAMLTREAETYLFAASGGDARILLNALEVAVLTTPPSEDGVRRIDLENMLDSLQRRAVHYDKVGEEHHNLISALHKSVRGSDPDAGLYWLARMLDAGEDPLYITRRLIRMAVEDIGLADPQALVQATSALSAYQLLGSPEGDLALAQVVVYLSLAPKSNTVYTSFKLANHTAKRTGSTPVPYHLRNAPTPLMKEIGYSRDYQYPHDDPRGWLPDEYLPDSLTGTVFYEPTARGWEGKFKSLLAHRRQQVAKRKELS
jgi:putative ATPase